HAGSVGHLVDRHRFELGPDHPDRVAGHRHDPGPDRPRRKRHPDAVVPEASAAVMKGITARTLGALLVAASSLAALPEPEPPVAPDLFGRTVEAVGFTADGPVDRREVTDLIAIASGAPLTEADVAATIQNLFKTLRFSNVVVTGEPVGADRVEVTVHLWRIFRISRIRFQGRTSLSRE